MNNLHSPRPFRTARAALTLTAVAAVIALSGCSSSASAFTGTWGSTGVGQPNLTIKNDGTFSGNDGCNNLSGKGSANGDTFTFGTFASTKMACEGVTTWLNDAATATISDGQLTVFDKGDTKIGTLPRG
ncbi:META domain-containing protein [Leifsonia aquatica]|uniref:META domain-containing protein n=1 Tax=Leifsonia aquatica TaxID=144185 RepID=UPI0004685F27|nr:META domain-containing protein [Leifsonia aquatica]